MDIVSWWADLAGTLVGTGVGFALAMLWDRKRDRDQETRERESSMRSILLNLEDIEERLHLPTVEDAGYPERPNWRRVILGKPYIAHAPFDAAVASGRLALFPPAMQERLSTTYDLVRQVQMHLDILNTSYSRPGGPDEHSALIGDALQHYSLDAPIAKDMIQRAIADLRQVLDIIPPPMRIPPPPGTHEPLSPEL
jgi:hypothetical protein